MFQLVRSPDGKFTGYDMSINNWFQPVNNVNNLQEIIVLN